MRICMQVQICACNPSVSHLFQRLLGIQLVEGLVVDHKEVRAVGEVKNLETFEVRERVTTYSLQFRHCGHVQSPQAGTLVREVTFLHDL